jgi:hypothetical protein
MNNDRRLEHAAMIEKLQASLVGNTQRLRVRKKTVSNLFRYTSRSKEVTRYIDLREYDKPLFINTAEETLEVQGLTTFESIVDFTLQHGLLPTVTPELKHITIGGAIVGIGIETNSYRYGFVHDSLLEVEVLLPDGQVVVCTPTNKYSDLFYGLPNSYGTFGYILRAKIQLRKAKPYVVLTTRAYDNVDPFLIALEQATHNPKLDYIESLVYSNEELYMVTATETAQHKDAKTIYGSSIFYKDISNSGKLCLPIKEYIFRYDPEWFWALPDTAFYKLFRKLSPLKYRNSSFYTHYVNWQRAITAKFPFIQFEDNSLEQLIQDWEVPWENAEKLLAFALDTFDLAGKPIMAVPIATPAKATCYPMRANKLYLNLGSYNYVKKKIGRPPYYNTKVMDAFCFKHEGIKMLYSTTFLSKTEFDKIYAGKVYSSLKQKYDSKGLLSTLYEKAVKDL